MVGEGRPRLPVSALSLQLLGLEEWKRAGCLGWAHAEGQEVPGDVALVPRTVKHPARSPVWWRFPKGPP